MTITSSIVYAVFMWLNGYYFGRKEHEFLPIYDIGFRFHLSTFLSHNSISILWFAFEFNSTYEKVSQVYIGGLIWLVFLTTHFIYFLYARKYSIKNLNKKDLFE